MSDTEVEIDRSNSGEWWRMRYRGKVDLQETEPTPAERMSFKQQVDNEIRMARAEERMREQNRNRPEGFGGMLTKEM